MTLLGSTGSMVRRRLSHKKLDYAVYGLAANSNASILARQEEGV